MAYVPYVVSSTYSSVHIHTSYNSWPLVLPHVYPVYATFWAPTPVKIWKPAAADSHPAAPADQATPVGSAVATAMLRIETLGDGVVRIRWLGASRPIREARVFLADSAQQSLQAALVDKDTPSALLRFSEGAQRIAYAGLTVTRENGLIETTLVPYRPADEPRP